MTSLDRIWEAGRRLDRAVAEKTGISRMYGRLWARMPQGLKKAVTRYVPVIALVLLVGLYGAALSSVLGDGGVSLRTRQEDGSSFGVGPRDPGGESVQAEPGTVGGGQNAAANAGRLSPTDLGISAQKAALPTQNVCGANNIIKTGPNQYPYAPQCVTKFSGDNLGETSRGVYRDRVRVAYYITTDPQTIATSRAAGVCDNPDCWESYARVWMDWFKKYYELYGRDIEVVYFRGGGREDNVDTARQDADKVIAMNPPVFAVLGGPLQAGSVYAERLASKGIICFCTASSPQEIYEKNAPYIYATLMASTQAYIHRAEYVAQRLCAPSGGKCTRKAQHAAAPRVGDPDLRGQDRTFGLIWFNNNFNDYATGVEFFKEELKRYGIALKKEVVYTNVEGCQVDAANMVLQLKGVVTSVLFAGDPICPITLTRQADSQGVSWEWIVTGSYLTDTNVLARLYHQGQWGRAFGVSMLTPDVKDENEAWFKMYKEAQGNRVDPKQDAALYLANPSLFYTGIHLAGANLSPKSFQAGMASVVKVGGTPTLALRSFGPKKVNNYSFWDFTAYDDMAELWWDPNQTAADGKTGAYWYPNAGKRYQWGQWPSSPPSPFVKEGATFGYEYPPD